IGTQGNFSGNDLPAGKCGEVYPAGRKGGSGTGDADNADVTDPRRSEPNRQGLMPDFGLIRLNPRAPRHPRTAPSYSTVTDLARLRGLSTSQPRSSAMW